MATPNANAIAASAFGGMSELQYQQVIVYLLSKILGTTMTPNQLADAAVCYCGDFRSLQQQTVYLLAQLVANGGIGGSGLQGVYYTSGSPTVPPNPAQDAIALDPNGILPTLTWNITLQTWK